MCTWWQRVSHVEQRCSSDDLDRAARVHSAHAPHGGRKVVELRLQLVQQRFMNVQQHVDLGVTQLQGVQPLVKGRV